MSWSTPKTDWNGETVDGVYTGDRFNAVDFNRIKNNLEYLRELAIKMYDEFAIQSVGSDKTVKDYFYADETMHWKRTSLPSILTVSRGLTGTAPTYAANGNTMDFKELNRLEGAILDLYDRLTNESEGRRTFTWNFGMKGGL